jgi:Ras-related protein Rab-2A
MSGVTFNYLLKYIIIGDPSVGKSNILLKYAHNKFTNEYQATIGVEFGAKNLTLDGKIFRIQIWDTAGQENFRSITRAYYKNSVCAIVTYDITNRNSFENVQDWIDEVKSQTPKEILLVLVGNKIDLENERVVSFDEGKKLSKNNDMLFFETSAKNGNGINDVFLNSCREIYQNIEKGFYDLNNEACGIKKGEQIDNGNINLEKDDENINKKKKCCQK